MSAQKKLRIAVISDMHCHAQGEARPKNSFLVAGASRGQVGQHPIQSLITLIRTEQLSADILICPGDLADKICSIGMMQAWDHLREVKVEMRCRSILVTIGNHDVDSRKQYDQDVFKIPKNLHPDFPIDDQNLVDCFWRRGFYFLTDNTSETDFLVLNTVIDHNDEATAKSGSFNEIRIEHLRQELQSRQSTIYNSGSIKNKIAVMHHHPLIHSSSGYGSKDTLEFGDQLMNLLGDYQFSFIIHGHRHDPKLTRAAYSGNEQLIFAAGSFSAYLNESWTTTRNLFHLITLDQSTDQKPVCGEINSWEFNLGRGWAPSTSQSAALPHRVGLEVPASRLSFQDIMKVCEDSEGGLLLAPELDTHFPELKCMLPAELEAMQRSLANAGYKFVVSSTGEIERCGRLPHRVS